MNIRILEREGTTPEADVLVYLILESAEQPEIDYDIKPGMTAHGKVTVFYGARGQQHHAVVGLGPATRLSAEMLRRAAGSAVRAFEQEGFRTAAVRLDNAAGSLLTPEETLEAWAEGWILGGYTFDAYKQQPHKRALAELVLLCEGGETASRQQSIEAARRRAESTMLARDWCNEPANVMTPEQLTERLVQRFEGEPFTRVNVFQGEALAQHGMNGLLAVAQGSRQQPALVEISYTSDPSQPLLALVGKGMTFDMGGMNVKTGRDLSEARFDMGGACAVIGALDLLIASGTAANVVAVIAIADNVPGAGALLPSSIVRYPNGLTVQVGNTDAEGRLILADGLLHAGRLGASEIIDIATLTGAVGHALGLRVAGVWGDPRSSKALHDLSAISGDRVWPMPLIDDDDALLGSDYADLNNISSSPYGGANAAALFLRRFVDEQTRWVHIDMANTVQSPSDRGYERTGATGFGVRLLADYVMQRAEQR
ncbi:leucyl aminopeptidase family protein [Paenibacillus guangzhouensis]|uniref:leucyl aminopeptidase family protein n=1 Tax=Paenibacillus guangzhouensis TaxID=1473112 RepID=UPI00126737D6|nr:leucyl aminopeptidase family protein [Paenibacillus guangzhouensis]